MERENEARGKTVRTLAIPQPNVFEWQQRPQAEGQVGQ